MDIMTGLSAISKTLEVTKELRNIDKEMDLAELKLRIADLTDGLLEAKQALIDAQERERELRAEIEELKATGRYEDDNGLLYEIDNEGERAGLPYCNFCYVRTGKLFRVRRRIDDAGFEFMCDNCEKGLGHHTEYGPIETDWDPLAPYGGN